MALHILGIASVAVTVGLIPLPRQIRYLHSVVQAFRGWLDGVIRDRAARAFAREVDARFDRYEDELQQPIILFTHVDQWGGTHSDTATINPMTGQPRMRNAVAWLHGWPIDEQVTDPSAPAIVRHGSFGRSLPDATTNPVPVPTITRARITRVLPTLNDSIEANNGGAA